MDRLTIFVNNEKNIALSTDETDFTINNLEIAIGSNLIIKGKMYKVIDRALDLTNLCEIIYVNAMGSDNSLSIVWS